ncbi:unnamed protein product [Heligmosomoides polygyrus]|uniref:EB domain-containing protein n=1 Tax=Heligmosomoides polygyrus TaxID=6339 RepID=A0A183GNX5_HELPZ|nr:unnamed protein product [Heligmosomoides polygyrus]
MLFVFVDSGSGEAPRTTVVIVSTQSSSTEAPTVALPIECPPGFFLIDGKLLFVEQKGCLSDEQCSAREPNATCDSGYCVCPVAKPLVHGGKCVSGCPEGFANIAGRCIVDNSYCSEKTITCQCKIGFTLNMDFENKDDTVRSNASDAEESASNSTLEDDVDVNKYLFQTDELITLLA